MKLHFILLLAVAVDAAAQSTIDAENSFAWGANCGWLNWRAERPNPGDGVRVTDTHLGGFAWSPNTGWIQFGNSSPANGIRYSNAGGADFGVNHDGAGNLSGFAWSANLGWINFGWALGGQTNRPRFDISSGHFSGLAWSANAGWVNLGSGLLRTETVSITDSDGDGISDSWELERAGDLAVLSGTGDADGDGIPDKQEYVLDTDPLVPNAPLRITRLSKLEGLDAMELEWLSRPTRIYAVEAQLELSATNWLSLGQVPGAPGSNTVVAIEQGPPNAFLRVGAKLPLSP